MAFRDRSEELVFRFWLEPEFVGEQWGIGVHDLDGNGYLDFYVNHHGQPAGEIIMNFLSGEPESIDYEIAGDLHGVTFFDVDQDGDADLLQAQGGRRGEATDEDDPGLFNKVLLNDDGELSKRNSVEDFGLEYALGRKRILSPVNLDGDLAIYVGVYNNRPDGSFPGQMFGRDRSGAYDPIDPVEVSGEIVKGVHFGTDRFVDIINLDHFERELRLYENRGSGFREVEVLSASGTQITDVVTGDFNGDLEAEVLFGRAGRRDGLFRQNDRGEWVDVSETSIPDWVTTTSILAPGDFDNDGDLDYAALKRQRDVDGVDVITYVNRGDGTFREGPRFFDPEIEGRSDYMISGDFNRDGALDLILTTSASIDGGEGSRDGVYVYLEGDAPARNNWLSIELRGTQSETGGLGARVYVTTEDGATRVLEQDGGVHYTSQNSTDLHFGLGRNEAASVRIVWPDGFEQRVRNVDANQHVVLIEQRDPRVFLGTIRDDELVGSKRDDRLSGRDGDDVMDGRRGDDVLRGGKGRDEMSGGGGADIFVFAATNESRASARRDIIEDFARGDTLDLSRLDANDGRSGRQAFDYIGRDDFDGDAGQLRFSRRLVEGDVDGDGEADFQIRLLEVAALRSEDLVL